MTFAAVRVGQLSATHLTRSDTRLLNTMWESDPTVAIALEENGWFVEVGVCGELDPDVRASVNEFLLSTFESLGFSGQFRAVVVAAQAQGLAFLRIHDEVEPTEGLPRFRR